METKTAEFPATEKTARERGLRVVAIGGARRFGTAAVDDSSADTLRVLHDAAHTPDLSADSLPQIILGEGWAGGPGGSESL